LLNQYTPSSSLFRSLFVIPMYCHLGLQRQALLCDRWSLMI
jgi:hypothetical protein